MSDEVVHLLTGASGGIISARCGVTAKSERKLPSTFSSWASDVTCELCMPAGWGDAKKAAAATVVDLMREVGTRTRDEPPDLTGELDRLRDGDTEACQLPTLARQAFGIEALIYVNLSYATFGVVEVAGKITEAAPIAAWSIGKSLIDFIRWVKSKGGTLLVTATNEYL